MAIAKKDKNNVVVIKYEPKKNTSTRVARVHRRGIFSDTVETLDENKNKTFVKTVNIDSKKNWGVFIKILGFLVILLLAVYVIQSAQGTATPKTFTSFLEYFTTNTPDIQIPFITVPSLQIADWGVFNAIREFVLLNIKLFNVLIFVVNGLINLVSYIALVFQWIFTV